MKAEIFSCGTELLLGDVLNTNAQYIAKRLSEFGIFVYRQVVIGDNKDRLMDAFFDGFRYADMIFVTGGLGPTKDDLTKETASEYFQKDMYISNNSLDSIHNYFDKQNKEMPENNKKQAFFPEDSIILKNDIGTAPGCIMKRLGKTIVLLPGPPKEMELMFDNYVIPYLEKLQECVLYSKTLRLIGIGESEVAQKIDDIIESQGNPTIASYCKLGEVTLRITANAKTKWEAIKLVEPMENTVRERLGEYIYGTDDDTIEKIIGDFLISHGLKISTAESCTGGLLAGRLINYPGISEAFMEGAVTYSLKAKMKRLGVSKGTLKKYGAVSKETAAEMAKGIAKASKTDIGVSVTGVAGPGASEGKPVGLVYVGIYMNKQVQTFQLNLAGDRQDIRNKVVFQALNLLRLELQKNYK